MAAVALGRDFEFKMVMPEVCPTGVAEVDAVAGGLPRGCLTRGFWTVILGPDQPDAVRPGAVHQP